MKYYFIFLIIALPSIFFSFKQNGGYNLSYSSNKVDPDLNQVNYQVLPISNFLKIKWTIPSNWERGFPFQQDGFLFPIYCHNYAVDANTGKKLYYSHIRNQKLFQKNSKDSIFVFRKSDMIMVIDIYRGDILLSSWRKCRYPLSVEPISLQDTILYYVTDRKTMDALDIKNNTRLWSFNSETFISEDAIKYKNTLFISDDDYLYGIDPMNAEIKLKVKMGQFMSRPLIINNLFYVMIADEGLICFNMDKMETKWVFNDMDNKFYKDMKLLIDDGVIYFINPENFTLYAVNIENGHLVWRNNEFVGYPTTIDPTSIVMINNIIVFDYTDEYIESTFGCDRQTGKLIYKFEREDKIQNRTDLAFIRNDFAFAENQYNNHLYAVGYDSIYCFEIINKE